LRNAGGIQQFATRQGGLSEHADSNETRTYCELLGGILASSTNFAMLEICV
jgi:hypothetical protein